MISISLCKPLPKTFFLCWEVGLGHGRFTLHLAGGIDPVIEESTYIIDVYHDADFTPEVFLALALALLYVPRTILYHSNNTTTTSSNKSSNHTNAHNNSTINNNTNSSK